MTTLQDKLHEADVSAFPYLAVLDAIQQVGKEFIQPQLLEDLAQWRRYLATQPVTLDTRLLAQFLDVVLDKYDGRYDYTTYLALPLLRLPDVDDRSVSGRQAAQRRDMMVCLLMADLVRFELAAHGGQTDLLPQLRPGPDLLAKRLHLIGRVVARPARHQLSIDIDPDDPASFVAAADQFMSAGRRLRLRLSMLPVATIHDEYLFIRGLQSYEITFAATAVALRDAVDALVRCDGVRAVRAIRMATDQINTARPLFSLIATMKGKAFQTFRTWTTGASAIQSNHYKLIESLCRRPDPQRLESLAYGSVPWVRERIRAGQVTLDDSLRLATDNGLPQFAAQAVGRAMAEFEKALLQWRNTHVNLAKRMLGNTGTGTGYTEGVGYLAKVRTTPVFDSTREADDHS